MVPFNLISYEQITGNGPSELVEFSKKFLSEDVIVI